MPRLATAGDARAFRSHPARRPLLWLIMGARVGDNNQLLALASALGCPFDTKILEYNALRRLPVFRHGLNAVAHRSRSLIRPPWPDLVLCVGYGSVAVARHIRQQSGGRTKLVHVGNPRENLEDFDLQITTPQYTGRAAANLVELPFAIGNPARDVRPTELEREWLEALPTPRRLVAVGGPARHWQLDHRALRRAICVLRDRQPTSSLIVATSPRTTAGTRRLLESLISGPGQALVHDFPRFATLLASSDEIYVTADSVSMLSEAILSGKPVGMIPIERSLRGRLTEWLWERPMKRATLPNFRAFWHSLRRRRLVGTVELPVASNVCDTVEHAADAVRALLAPGDWIDGGRTARTGQDLGTAWRSSGRQQPGDRARRGAATAVRRQGARI
jgi:mitochondrial fission protein ELM1